MAKFMVRPGRLARGVRTSVAMPSIVHARVSRAPSSPARGARLVSLVGRALLSCRAMRSSASHLDRLRGCAGPLKRTTRPCRWRAGANAKTRDPAGILRTNLPVQDGFLLAFRVNTTRVSTRPVKCWHAGKAGDAIACRENGIAGTCASHQRRPLNDAIKAFTGASVDAERDPTLVPGIRARARQRARRSSWGSAATSVLAAHILGKHDCSLVVAQDLAEALAALDQDVYNLVLVDTSLAGLAGDDAATVLRARIARNPEAARLVATSIDHSPTFRAEKMAIGFNDTLAKPFRKETLTELLGAEARASATEPSG